MMDKGAAAKSTSLLKDIPKWAWVAGGAGVVVILILRLRSSSSTASTADPTLVAPVAPTDATSVDTSGSALGSGVSTVTTSSPDYTSELTGIEQALQGLLQQAMLRGATSANPPPATFPNTIHPIAPNPPSYPGGSGNYLGPSGAPNPGYVGPLPGSPAFGQTGDIHYIPYQGPSLSVGHPFSVTSPGLPASPLHAGIGRVPVPAIRPPAPVVTR